uniref:GPN-loop GTPase 2 n=1 Tax=Eutreptiella gymnastica TaxID=73025 RepID=A0A7S1I577_9EUGL|mmetsp:Transcript_130868/g.226472  ORF Transcript_130868/g.226472 Transcript_130868/m.226472 type:complete len:284 (+) Transcript_130868:12-863(+)
MLYGQLVFGPPGSGKTTYCNGMSQFMTELGRPVAIVNLDPANDTIPYTPAIDIRSLVTLEQVMAIEELGPNGGFIYCMEYLEQNLDWLNTALGRHPDTYFLFDCPGQVELYTIHDSFKRIVEHLQRKLEVQLCAVNLVDALYCCNPHNFLSALLVSLTSMLQLELPHVNVLSKIDLLKLYAPGMDFSLDYYTEVQDLGWLVERVSAESSHRYQALNRCIAEVVEDFSLVSFHTLDIQQKESVAAVLKSVDKANGFAFQGATDGPGIWGATAQIMYDQYLETVD